MCKCLLYSLFGGKHTAIVVNNNLRQRAGNRLGETSPDEKSIKVIDKYIPAGSYHFTVEDASYLRLKNVTLSYDLSDVFRKWSHLNDRNSRLSVYFSGENLATITGYSGMDPECGGWDALKYPVSRVLSVGVKLTY